MKSCNSQEEGQSNQQDSRFSTAIISPLGVERLLPLSTIYKQSPRTTHLDRYFYQYDQAIDPVDHCPAHPNQIVKVSKVTAKYPTDIGETNSRRGDFSEEEVILRWDGSL